MSFTGKSLLQNYTFLKSLNFRPQIRPLHWFPAQASAQSSCPENPHFRWHIFGNNLACPFRTNLWHQIILGHKYCESPAQVGLVFKYIKYLPGEGENGNFKESMRKPSVAKVCMGESHLCWKYACRKVTCDESMHVRRCGRLGDKQNQALQHCSPELRTTIIKSIKIRHVH